MGFGGFGGFSVPSPKKVFKKAKDAGSNLGGLAGDLLEAPFRLIAPDIDMPDIPEPQEEVGEVPTLPDPDNPLNMARKRRAAAQRGSSRMANINDSMFNVGNGLGG
jgi:hypothetical protein